MEGRTYTSSRAYRHGFNGKENDNEVKGEGNALDFGARIYDSRIGRWFSTDPLQAKYAYLSSYQFVNNSPLLMVDREGKDFGVYIDEKTGTITIAIKATYYTENNQRVYDATLAAANYLNERNSDKYKFVHSTGKVYTIKIELTVMPIRKENGKTNDQISGENAKKARADHEANFVYNSEFGPYTDFMGQTARGGDFMALSDFTNFDRKAQVLEQPEVKYEMNAKDFVELGFKTQIHEILHSLGVSHDLIGLHGPKEGADYTDIVKTILAYANKYQKDGSNSMKVKDVKKKWLLKATKTDANNMPGSSTVEEHQPKTDIKSKDKESKLKEEVKEKQIE